MAKEYSLRQFAANRARVGEECIEQNSGNGYVWHTTGSGKTLTSFKASTLLKDNPAIEKCLFVVTSVGRTPCSIDMDDESESPKSSNTSRWTA